MAIVPSKIIGWQTDFKDFLIKKVKPENNIEYPYCNACSQYLADKKHSINVPKETDVHKKSTSSLKEKQNEQNRIALFLNNPVEIFAKHIELRLSLLVSQRNLAFSLPQEILSIFKRNCLTIPFLIVALLAKRNLQYYQRRYCQKSY